MPRAERPRSQQRVDGTASLAQPEGRMRTVTRGSVLHLPDASCTILVTSDSRAESWGGAGRPPAWLTGSLCCLAFPIALSTGCTSSWGACPPSLLPMSPPLPSPGITATAELAGLEAGGAFDCRLTDAADINGAVLPPMPTVPPSPWSNAAMVPRLAPPSCHVLCCLVLVAGLLLLELLRRTRTTGGAATKSGASSGCKPRRRARVVCTTRYAGRCGGVITS